MIGHNHKFIYGDSRDSIAANNIILYDLTDFRQGNHRGVEAAAPYDVARICFLSWVQMVTKYAPL